MEFNNRLLEAAHIHHGSFKDIQTFLNSEGDPYDLQSTILKSEDESSSKSSSSTDNSKDRNQESSNSSGGGGGSSSSQDGQNLPQDNQSPNAGGGEQTFGDESPSGESSQDSSSDNSGSSGGSSGESGENNQQNNEQSGSQSQQSGSQGDQSQNDNEPEKVTPKKGQLFRDITSGKLYKWDGKKFIISR